MRQILSVLLVGFYLVVGLTLSACGPTEKPTDYSGLDLITTESGLQYTDLEVGEGPTPSAGDLVFVHYTGRLTDGTEFDSSYKRGQPFNFMLGEGRVIKGWDEGVSTMTVGTKRLLVIPPELAYGSRGVGQIPPNSTLEFEVELLDIQAATESTPTTVSNLTENQPSQSEVTPSGDQPVLSDRDLTTTASGLQYQDLEVGDGPTPQAGDQVVVHYVGRLTDGTVFDASYDRGQPFSFTLGQGRVIKGWEEGVATMTVGTKRLLVIPPELGYGSRGAGGIIPPNATLEFEVELLDIQ